MSGKHYLGKAGHLAVMSELAFLGYNVATPEVDIGDDVFAVNDLTGALYRIQVKTSTATRQSVSNRCTFSLRMDQLRTPQNPELHYAFVTKISSHWHYVIISRAVLYHLQGSGLGSIANLQNNRQSLTVNITFHDDGRVMAGRDHDLSRYYNNWDTWSNLRISS